MQCGWLGHWEADRQKCDRLGHWEADRRKCDRLGHFPMRSGSWSRRAHPRRADEDEEHGSRRTVEGAWLSTGGAGGGCEDGCNKFCKATAGSHGTGVEAGVEASQAAEAWQPGPTSLAGVAHQHGARACSPTGEWCCYGTRRQGAGRCVGSRRCRRQEAGGSRQ